VECNKKMNQAALTQRDADFQEAFSPCIEVKDLRMSYDGQIEILKGISFEIQVGESIALLGHNGSGKSTLLKCLMGIEGIGSGELRLLGESLSSKSRRDAAALRSKMGFVFQHHNLVPRLSVLTNVIHGALANSASPRLWYQGIAPRKVREKALDMLESVGLAEFAARRADQLSGGQSQRVALARALMQGPQIILADEPVASLDPQAGEGVMSLLHALCRERSITLVFSTHHLEHCVEYADRILALKEGVLLRDMATSEVRLKELRGIYE